MRSAEERFASWSSAAERSTRPRFPLGEAAAAVAEGRGIKPSAFQTRSPEVRDERACVAEVRPPQVGVIEVRIAQVRPTEPRPAQIRTGKRHRPRM
jgi:hypothetical protein